MTHSTLKLHQETLGEKGKHVISSFLMRSHLLPLQHALIVKVIRSLGEEILKLRVAT